MAAVEVASFRAYCVNNVAIAVPMSCVLRRKVPVNCNQFGSRSRPCELCNASPSLVGETVLQGSVVPESDHALCHRVSIAGVDHEGGIAKLFR